MVKDNSNLQVVMCKGRKAGRKEGGKEVERHIACFYINMYVHLCTKQKKNLHFLVRILLGIIILGPAIVDRNIQQDMFLVSFIK